MPEWESNPISKGLEPRLMYLLTNRSAIKTICFATTKGLAPMLGF